MKACWTCVATMTALALPGLARAQTLRGAVVDRASVPVPGVVVSLLDIESMVVTRALTDERGMFRLVAAHGGTFRVRTLRIGYRPTTSEPISLGAGQDVSQTIVVTGIPFSLAAVRIEARSACRPVADPAAAAMFEVWEQARAALMATQLTAAARAVIATTITYDRTLDPTGRRVLEQNASVRSQLVTQPWRELSPDNLRRLGYVVTDPDRSVTYHAPGLDALLSSVFVEDHCFRLIQGSSGRLGIAFEPTAARQGRRAPAEIRGALWIDRTSAELRSLDFRYTNIPSAQEEHAGGTMDFVRMSNGAWAISQWAIRTPVLEAIEAAPKFGGTDTSIAAIKVTGGVLALATTRAGDTVWMRPPLTLAGTVTDSASGSPVRGARLSLTGTNHVANADARGRFTIASVLPGAYTLEVRTPSLDSAGIAYPMPLVFVDTTVDIEVRAPTASQTIVAICGRTRLAAPGVIVGTVVMRGDTLPPQRAKVIAEWDEPPMHSSGDVTTLVDRQIRWLEAPADRNGTFRLCGVPLNTSLVLRAEHDSAGMVAPTEVRIPPNGRFARAQLVLDRSAARGAVFAGTVLADSNARILSGAEVAFPDLGKTVLTDEQGRFRLGDIRPGTHRVFVRRLGYVPLDTAIAFRTNQTIDRRILLRRVVTLDSVNVVAEQRNVPNSFEENRRLGLGQFITRDALAKEEGRKLSDVLRELRGSDLEQGTGGRAWLLSSRSPAALGKTDIYYAEPHEMRQGMRKEGCYAQVYQDDVLLNPSNPTEPFDVNTIVISQVEAIEYYSGPAQTPAKYNRLGGHCGVLVIWTRRSP